MANEGRFEAEFDLDPDALRGPPQQQFDPELMGALNGRIVVIGRPRMLFVEGNMAVNLDGRVYPPGYRPSWDKAKEAEEPPVNEDKCNEG
jgi:hypothetical protein